MVVDDTIVVAKLVTRDAFAELVAGEVGDPAASTRVVHCLTASDRESVDDGVATALASGGTRWLPARDDETSYTGSFADPDSAAAPEPRGIPASSCAGQAVARVSLRPL